MRVYIGMEMPSECGRCDAAFPNGVDYSCCLIKGYPLISSQRSTRLKNCPLIPVPDQGRLIDADALWVNINKICDRRDNEIITDLTCLQQILSEVRHAPTVIPEDMEG